MMKRELHFRAWDGEEMVFCGKDNYWAIFDDEKMSIGWGLYNRQDGRRLLSGEHCPPLMQKTGMQDKNGKDIWEGDIMNWNAKINALVKWSIPNGGFMLLLPNGDTRPFCYDVIYDREVIGNIHETPELLRDVAAIA